MSALHWLLLSISQRQRWRTRLQQSPTWCVSLYRELKLDLVVLDVPRRHFRKASFKDTNESYTISFPLLPSLIKGPVFGLISSLNLTISDPVNLVKQSHKLPTGKGLGGPVWAAAPSGKESTPKDALLRPPLSVQKLYFLRSALCMDHA